MKPMHPTFIGIDVGGPKKGFHVIALRHKKFETAHFYSAEDLRDWCLNQKAQVIAIDAPCGWSSSGHSREAERTLRLNRKIIQCFKTPTRNLAQKSAFYSWVFQGEKIYQTLQSHFDLYENDSQRSKVMFETFPQGIACCLANKILSASAKATDRPRLLKNLGFNLNGLSSIDFIDAALCAVSALYFNQNSHQSFGNPQEGFIILPKKASGTISVV